VSLLIVSRTFTQASWQVKAASILAVFNVFVIASPARSADPKISNEGAAVNVVHATNECFSALVRVSGFFVPRVEAALGIDGDGSRITEVLVGEGDDVTAGQVLARFARPSYEPSSPPGGAAVPPGAAMAPGPASSTGVLRAPSAGRVTQSTARVGGTASMMGEPLFRLAVGNEIEVEAEVPSVHVPLLAPGQTARVEVEKDRELKGEVRLVFVEIDPMTQLGRARISVASEPSLRVGKFVRATIVARRSCGISVPGAAISYRPEGTTVQVVRNGIVEVREVRVGLRSERSAEIDQGLSEGDVVVANAGSSLRNGDMVKPVFRSQSD
jgi:multidrug efflux pump subunit AcrA (membrane-fusion protein)